MRIASRGMTVAMLRVLAALGQAGPGAYGFALMRATGLRSSIVYPVLDRLQAARLVRIEWDYDDIPPELGRHRRRYYQLTRRGAAWAEVAAQVCRDA